MDKKFITSINPATLEELGKVEVTPPNKVAEYAAKAAEAQAKWERLSFKQRGEYLLKARSYLLKNIDEFALTITKDNGKPLIEALTAEIYPVADLLYYFAHHTEKLLRPYGISTGIWKFMLRRSKIRHQPLGVVGVISPWNNPFSIPVGTVAMALMAGNAVLLKPSSATPFVGERIAEMFKAAGLPEFVFIHMPGDAATGEALINTHLDKIVFTGSVDVGKRVMALCAENLTPCTLELGGKDPMIVRHDADLEHASSGAVWGAFTNSGQCCASIERVYVHESIANEFIDLVVNKTSLLKQGLGTDYDVDLGPMTTYQQLQIVEAQVEEASIRGAKIWIGGERNPSFKGYFFLPTIITNVDHTFSCVRDETFGPILPIMAFKDDEEALKLANDSKYGLNAYIWTGDIKKGQEMARYLRCGTVMINDSVYTHAIPETPWGGRGLSGFGRTHGKIGLIDLVNIHHTHTNHITFLKDMWWYRYSKGAYQIFKSLTKELTGGWLEKITALPTLLKAIKRKKI